MNKHDLIGLIAAGAPLDEYDIETGSVLPLIAPGQSVDVIQDCVYDVFVRYFGTDGTAGPRSAYTPIANEIHAWLNSSEF